MVLSLAVQGLGHPGEGVYKSPHLSSWPGLFFKGEEYMKLSCLSHVL